MSCNCSLGIDLHSSIETSSFTRTDSSRRKAGMSMASHQARGHSPLANQTCRVRLASGTRHLPTGILEVLQSLFCCRKTLHHEIHICSGLFLETFISWRDLLTLVLWRECICDCQFLSGIVADCEVKSHHAQSEPFHSQREFLEVFGAEERDQWFVVCVLYVKMARQLAAALRRAKG